MKPAAMALEQMITAGLTVIASRSEASTAAFAPLGGVATIATVQQDATVTPAVYMLSDASLMEERTAVYASQAGPVPRRATVRQGALATLAIMVGHAARLEASTAAPARRTGMAQSATLARVVLVERSAT